MKEDVEVPFIPGRPFMKTTKVIIDVDGGKLQLKDQEEEVNFSMLEGIYNLEAKDFSAVKEVLFETSKLG